MGESQEKRTESTIIVERELITPARLKAKIRSEWGLKEWVTIDLVFEDDAGELQRTVHVMLRGEDQKPRE